MVEETSANHLEGTRVNVCH